MLTVVSIVDRAGWVAWRALALVLALWSILLLTHAPQALPPEPQPPSPQPPAGQTDPSRCAAKAAAAPPTLRCDHSFTCGAANAHAAPGSLQLVYISADDAKGRARAAALRHSLQPMLHRDRSGLRLLAEHSPQRLPALVPSCGNNASCAASALVSGLPPLLSGIGVHVAAVMSNRPPANRRAVVGCWLSHLHAMRQFSAAHNRSRAGAADDLLLVLEDDVVVSPTFLDALPCWLAQLPHRASWHVLRFNTWGKSDFESDAVPGERDSPTFYANPHSMSGAKDYVYGGSHAALYQGRTIDALVAKLVAKGASPLDAALRNGGGIVSYAVSTKLVRVGRMRTASSIPKAAAGTGPRAPT